jgi:hypothetical protein
MFKSLYFNQLYWPTMRGDCQRVVLECPDCQRFNIGKHGFHPLRSIDAKLPWDHIAIDLKEFCKSLQGNKYMLVVVDVCTRFVFLKALPNKEMTTVARALFSIFTTIGFPKIIQSDNGTEFVNSTIKELTKLAHIDHRLISAYHPQANGLAERNVQTSSMAILKHLNGKDNKWDLYVDVIQYFMNTKVTAIHGSTPYSLMFARPVSDFTDYSQSSSALLSPEQVKERLSYMSTLVYPTIAKKVQVRRDNEATQFEKSHKIVKEDKFPPGSFVMCLDELKSSSMQPSYTGPFAVIRRTKGGSYLLKGRDGTEYSRSVHKLKLVHQSPIIKGNSYEVESILNDYIDDQGHWYFVKWKGYSDDHNSWIIESNFDDLAPIRAYHKRKSETSSLPLKRPHESSSSSSKFKSPPKLRRSKRTKPHLNNSFQTHPATGGGVMS